MNLFLRIYFFITRQNFKITKNAMVLNQNEWSINKKASFREFVQSLSGIPVFDGEIAHAYDSISVNDCTCCPHCKSPTRQQYATFSYGTTDEIRKMLVPAGYFCIACPTVVIDQEMIKTASLMNTNYETVLGIEGKDNKIIFFKSWNGKKIKYFYENDLAIGFVPVQESIGTIKKKRKKL